MERSLTTSKRLLADPSVDVGPEIHFSREEFYSQAFDHMVSGTSLLLKKASDNERARKQHSACAIPGSSHSRSRSNSTPSLRSSNRVVVVMEGVNGRISIDVDLRAALWSILMDGFDNPSRRPKSIQLPPIKMDGSDNPSKRPKSVQLPPIEMDGVDNPSRRPKSLQLPLVEMDGFDNPPRRPKSLQLPLIEVDTRGDNSSQRPKSLQLPPTEMDTRDNPSWRPKSLQLPPTEMDTRDNPSWRPKSLQLPPTEMDTRDNPSWRPKSLQLPPTEMDTRDNPSIEMHTSDNLARRSSSVQQTSVEPVVEDIVMQQPDVTLEIPIVEIATAVEKSLIVISPASEEQHHSPDYEPIAEIAPSMPKDKKKRGGFLEKVKKALSKSEKQHGSSQNERMEKPPSSSNDKKPGFTKKVKRALSKCKQSGAKLKGIFRRKPTSVPSEAGLDLVETIEV
ncbi:hypothetical protein BC936DRAFT_146669 [Jimgerdemannia flammicorona]|uniref:Uncharacterized protein n=1 Tax=Jimgerdemannia flammicorona TaxID=994334 RepID=A0A433D711_9FUNG|nr:hypothetical protein BC936DRAFT_146669 [Jimgerdemannia flammicorona]